MPPRKRKPAEIPPRGESLVSVRRIALDLAVSVDERLKAAAEKAGLSKKRFLEQLITEHC